MKALIKALNWLEWISAVIGVVFIILGLIQVVFGRLRPSTEIINYFHIANSFFLMAIVLFLFIHLGQFKKE
jgi:hypothetical protein